MKSKIHNRIEIKASKQKLLGLILISFLFLILGIWLLYSPENHRRYSPIVVQAIGISSAIMGGLGTIVITRKLFDNNLGIILDEKGITDNITAVKVGTIEWEDIQFVRIEKVHSKMLLIFVHNPDKYIGRAKNAKGMKNNLALCGTPFCIPSSILSCNLEQLEKMINTELHKYRENANK